MKKFLSIFFLSFGLFSPGAFAIEKQDVENLTIISRAEWGVDEEFGYRDSTYWQEKLAAWSKQSQTPLTEAQKQAQEKAAKLYAQKISYINTYFAKENTITERITDSEEGRPLAWKIQKSDYVNAIVVHHSATEYSDSWSGIKDIYRYHALSRSWGDIGYNYIIGYDGEIFEGKKGGDYTVAAHSVWNNISTVSIAVIGDYETKPINDLQYTSLQKLIQYLALKYGIDLGKEYYYNMECANDDCKGTPLFTNQASRLVGHKDTGNTSCPGDELYKQIAQIRTENLEFTKGFIPVKRGEENINLQKKKISSSGELILKLQNLEPTKLEKLLGIIEEKIDTTENTSFVKKLQILRILVKKILES